MTDRDLLLLALLAAGLLSLFSQPLHGRPFSPQPPTTLSFPTNRETVKITVDQDGIYQITHADLLAAGIDVTALNPNTLTMMHRGKPIATQFLGDGDDQFEAGEAIRFFGWAFDGPRIEQQFVSHNVFWLWSGGTPTPIAATANRADAFPTIKTTTTATVTAEIDQDFFSTWTDRWPTFPNEPDAWYWRRLPHSGIGLTAEPITATLTIPHPDTTAVPDATWLVEVTSRAKAAFPGTVPHTVTISLNNGPPQQHSWNGRQNRNLTQTVPHTVLQDGTNVATAVITTPDVLYLNRITVTYRRRLIVANDQLHFRDDTGSQTLQLSGLSETDPANVLVWDVTQRQRPLRVPITADHLSSTGELQFATDRGANGRYFVTTQTNLRTPPQIDTYTPPDLNPPHGGAAWLAITHSTLRPAAERLAAHRAHTGLTTHVVDIADVIAQYGHGLPLPESIRAYLRHAQQTWTNPPAYVLLLGDATVNPRRRPCRWSCAGVGWDTARPTLIPTDLRFVDRFQGLIPTDHALALLDDNDPLADVAIGRIAAATLPEARAAVDKIINYEQNHADPAAWSQSLLFVADDADAAGNFCGANRAVGDSLPSTWPQHHLCLPDGTTADDVALLQAAMYQQVNQNGTFLLNYRGHGSIQHWGSGGGATILSVAAENSSLGAWLNDRPTVIISADCLDGHFAWPGVPSISETLLTLAHRGTAAHWSSAGLGTDAEHTRLHRAFYDALQQPDTITIGDAIMRAKTSYYQSGAHPSILYAFTLQGDPAMPLWWKNLSRQHLPLVTQP